MTRNPFLTYLRAKHEKELNVLREERKELKRRKDDLIQKQKLEVIAAYERWQKQIESPDYDAWMYNKHYSISEAEKFRAAARVELYKALDARVIIDKK